jgi:hypothetical protein
MAIYQYDGSQKTPKNYIGFRVAVSVNGELRQKWYKKTKKLPKEATDLERQWKFEQQLHKISNIRDRTERAQNSAYITGVSGIKMKFQASIRRKKAYGKMKVYRSYTPVFIVSGSKNKQRFIKRFNIKTLGYDMAWFKACQYAAEKYGETLLDNMLKQKPLVEQFQLIYRWQTKQGHDIPVSRLPNELL